MGDGCEARSVPRLIVALEGLPIGRRYLSSRVRAARMPTMSSIAADLLLTDLDVYCNDGRGTWGREIAIKDGRILAVGASDGDLAEFREGPNTEVLAMPGRLACPGSRTRTSTVRSPVATGCGSGSTTSSAGTSTCRSSLTMPRRIQTSPGSSVVVGLWRASLADYHARRTSTRSFRTVRCSCSTKTFTVRG